MERERRWVVDQWKKSFLSKLKEAQDHCADRFEKVLEDSVQPTYSELASFLQDNGFKIGTPVEERGRRSFKFELSENAYVLCIFRSAGVGEFELRIETLIPGREPSLHKVTGGLGELDKVWARNRFQEALDAFVSLLSAQSTPVAKNGDLVAV